MRIWLDKGYLIEAREIEDARGNTYVMPLEFQVFDETGAPSTRTYRGEGTVHDGRIILGDPYRDTQLIEGKIDRQATSESWERYQGFKAALEDRTQESSSKPKKHYAHTADWWQGYQTGWTERREAQKKKKPTPNAGGTVSFANREDFYAASREWNALAERLCPAEYEALLNQMSSQSPGKGIYARRQKAREKLDRAMARAGHPYPVDPGPTPNAKRYSPDETYASLPVLAGAYRAGQLRNAVSHVVTVDAEGSLARGDRALCGYKFDDYDAALIGDVARADCSRCIEKHEKIVGHALAAPTPNGMPSLSTIQERLMHRLCAAAGPSTQTDSGWVSVSGEHPRGGEYDCATSLRKLGLVEIVLHPGALARLTAAGRAWCVAASYADPSAAHEKAMKLSPL